MKNITEIAKSILMKNMPHDGIYVDCNMSSGLYSLYLSQWASEGKVYSFGQYGDIDTTCELFESNYIDNVILINDSVVNIDKFKIDSINASIYCCDNVETEGLNKLIGKLAKNGRILIITKNNLSEYFLIQKTKLQIINLNYVNNSALQLYLIEKII